MPTTANERDVCVDRLDLAELLDYVGTDIEGGLIDVPVAVVEAHQRLRTDLQE